MDFEQLVAFRRELHRNPEPAFLEIGTAARIEQALEGLEIRVRTGKAAQDLSAVVNFPAPETLDEWAARAADSGVPEERARYFRENGTALVVDVVGARPGPRWGLRVDIDALPMRESADAAHFPVAGGFASTNGAMHACGHDAHATIGVGLLHRLSDHDFAGTLRVLFQPAEEGVRGAQTMIDAGVADEIDNMLAVHMAGDMAVGRVVGSFTGGMATRKLKVDFAGRAAHAAGTPEAGRNALLAASMSALGIMGLPRFSSADTRLNVGTLVAGDGVNIVPSSAVMTCEARATDDEVVDELVDRVRSMVEGASLAHGVRANVAVMGQSATVAPDDELIDRIVDVATAHDDVTEVIRTRAFAGSDDANLLIRHVQRHGGKGAYLMVGAGSPGPHHSENFDIAEESIPTAIGILESLIRG
ncbi:amidohydrolase [Streptomyces rapamycinicus]|uniref:Peptidase M20 n=2 Tax=Streptomyces rapamycinicus TaxID=1226757 RepID=A0A0A0N5S0_STRRN|nr:amidohydrolase [Streptomyces rapamycinicus]AGP52271.1 peptidase M20 [Streptomyces rapamycinicus NRRL 5491]MBB4779731.1 aminobenzoyl-glutamate utilization protein A [Streptomyces rapamycinicus]RLV75609.1 peptidase M20 [Streptomyces rapamycinicus NRRL 5491]UTP28463.1 amidohydrolase [Streptomyces rapamycinicus NRRL 5491]